MDSPVPYESRPLAPWRNPNVFHSQSSTPPTSMAPDHAPTSMPMSYTPEYDAMSAFTQSPPVSIAGTPISPPASLSHRRIYPIMDQSVPNTPPPLDPRLQSPYNPPGRSNSNFSSQQSIPRSSVSSTDNDHEVAFLLRWFSEGPGYWMDLFDLGTYFASYVPVKARENPLLKYAAIACAAKALARVQGRKPVMGGSVIRQARMELYPDAALVDWKHKAAVFYDNAVSLLLQALKNNSSNTPEHSDCEARNHDGSVMNGDHSRSAKRRRTSSNADFVCSPDETLAASAILCVYEFLDTSVSEWAKHLNGAKSLLVQAQDRMMPMQMPTPSSTMSNTSYNFISKARRATFWNIARQDMLAACKSNSTCTPLL